MYMEWIHEKTLRNKKLIEFQKNYIYRTACVICRTPPYIHPPSTNQDKFQSIGGLNQHPNSSSDM